MTAWLAVLGLIAAARVPVRVVYVAAPGITCAPIDSFAAQVTARLGQNPFAPDAPEALEVTVTHEGGGYDGRLAVRGRDGTLGGARRLRAGSCGEVIRSLAVAASVLLEARTDSPAADHVPTVGLAPPPPPAVPVRWQLSASPVVALVGPATFTAGNAAAVARVWDAAALGLELRGLASAAEPVGRGHVRTQTFVASVLPCARRWGVTLCAALTAGAVHASAGGFDVNASIWRPHLAGGARLGYQLGGGRWHVRPYAWLETPVVRWRFDVDETEVARQAAVSAGLGLELVVDR